MQKTKLLRLWELLQRETAEDHPISTSALCARLHEMGISVDRRTLSKDIDALNEAGFEVMSRFRGHHKVYYVEDRSFSIPELKLLMDAVQSARLITPTKTKALMEKIADLGGSYHGQILSGSIIQFNTRKHNNESIYYNIDAAETAISQGKQVSFRYFKLDENRQRVYRREGSRYVVEPVALVYHEDFYYLCCYDSKRGNIINFRVDRMDKTEIQELPISAEAKEAQANLSEYTDSIFKMYSGEETAVELLFHNEMMSSVYDRFGEEVEIKRVDAEHCTATVTVQISEMFWGWVFQYGAYMKVLSPAWAVEAYKEELRKTLAAMDK